MDSGTLHCQTHGASGDVVLAPDPGITAQVSEAIGQGDGVFGFLQYYFEVIGPTSGPVNVLVDASLMTRGTVSGVANVQYFIDGITIANVCSDGSCAASSYTGSTLLSLYTGTQHTIRLEAEAREDYFFGGTAYAMGDPYIHVDPRVSNASAYQILVSPDVGNISAVPEPTSWALMISGLGLVGAFLRRRPARPSRSGGAPVGAVS